MRRGAPPATRLALFDLDGTLVDTTAVDAACYIAAVAAELGVELTADWSGFRHCTDSGVTHEVVTAHLGRPPAPEEVDRVRGRFVALLRERAERDPAAFAELPGVRSFLAALAPHGWHAAIATGGWSASAEVKRRAAGLTGSIPLFSSDDHHEREAILRHAIRETAARHGLDGYQRVVSVGDAVWDVTAAARLGLPFVGVGRGEGARALRAAGAGAVVADFTDPTAVLAELEAARPPASGTAVGPCGTT